jgi:hypothetical protein
LKILTLYYGITGATTSVVATALMTLSITTPMILMNVSGGEAEEKGEKVLHPPSLRENLPVFIVRPRDKT